MTTSTTTEGPGECLRRALRGGGARRFAREVFRARSIATICHRPDARRAEVADVARRPRLRVVDRRADRHRRGHPRRGAAGGDGHRLVPHPARRLPHHPEQRRRHFRLPRARPRRLRRQGRAPGLFRRRAARRAGEPRPHDRGLPPARRPPRHRARRGDHRHRPGGGAPAHRPDAGRTRPGLHLRAPRPFVDRRRRPQLPVDDRHHCRRGAERADGRSADLRLDDG